MKQEAIQDELFIVIQASARTGGIHTKETICIALISISIQEFASLQLQAMPQDILYFYHLCLF